MAVLHGQQGQVIGRQVLHPLRDISGSHHIGVGQPRRRKTDESRPRLLPRPIPTTPTRSQQQRPRITQGFETEEDRAQDGWPTAMPGSVALTQPHSQHQNSDPEGTLRVTSVFCACHIPSPHRAAKLLLRGPSNLMPSTRGGCVTHASRQTRWCLLFLFSYFFSFVCLIFGRLVHAHTSPQGGHKEKGLRRNSCNQMEP